MSKTRILSTAIHCTYQLCRTRKFLSQLYFFLKKSVGSNVSENEKNTEII